MRVRSAGAWANLFHHGCPGSRSIAFPNLAAGQTIAGDENERAVEIRQVSWRGVARARIDVFYHRRPGGRAVALPKLQAAVAVGGCEIGDAIDDGKGGWVRRGGGNRVARNDGCAARRAVAG